MYLAAHKKRMRCFPVHHRQRIYVCISVNSLTKTSVSLNLSRPAPITSPSPITFIIVIHGFVSVLRCFSNQHYNYCITKHPSITSNHNILLVHVCTSIFLLLYTSLTQWRNTEGGGPLPKCILIFHTHTRSLKGPGVPLFLESWDSFEAS